MFFDYRKARGSSLWPKEKLYEPHREHLVPTPREL